MRIALRKIRRDLWQNKGRTLLVVASIAVGVMAVGLITSSLSQVTQQMSEAHLASNPSHAWLYLSGSVDEDTVRSISNIQGVEQVEGFTDIGIKWKASPEDEWQDGSLIMIRDYQDQQFDRLILREGQWPDIQAGAVYQNHIEPFGTPGVGEVVYIEVNDRARSLPLIGSVHDPFQYPPPFNNSPAFYVTRDMLERLTGGFSDYNRLRFSIYDFSDENLYTITDQIEDKLEEQGVFVSYFQELHPERHFLQDMVDGIGLVLTVMAVASLGLSTILVINTINALIAQQVPQIGIMKAVGGLRSQISTLYLAGVFVYGLLSLSLAVPLGAIGGNAFSRWMLYLLNVPLTPYEILPNTLMLQISTGLLTPLLAALFPILKGAAIAVARALSQYGLGSGQYGASWLDRLIGRVRGLPRLAVLSLRNTFRRPGRVILTQLTLMIAGAIFIMVLSTHHSFNLTIEKIFESFGFDVLVGFEQDQLIDEVIPLIESRPNVERAEMWAYLQADASVPGEAGPENEFDVDLRGVPRDTQLFSPELVAGRPLLPEDGRALLLNQKLAGSMGVGVGDQVTIDLGETGKSTWTVVGLIFDLGGRSQSTAYMYIDSLNSVTNQVGRASVAEVRGVEETLAVQKAIEEDLKTFFEAKGVGVQFTDTALENRQQANAQFSILTTVLLTMTILMASVGGIGMSGLLSINVIERRREIGVMRAVGASSRDVGLVFTGEGLLLGLVSWLQSVPIGLLAGPVFVSAITRLIDFPAVYYPALHGIWIWLGVIIALSLVASWLPARRATLISVNASLSYE